MSDSKHSPFAFLAVTLITLLAGNVQANPITTLFNTGVNNAGTVLSDNTQEMHYSLISGPITGTPFVATAVGGFPITGTLWMGDNTTSAWIAPTTSTSAVSGNYTYRTSFSLAGFNPSSAIITGVWATDFLGLDILINGISTGINTGSYQNFSPVFTINNHFIAGTNTLDFVVFNTNTSGPTGLRVQISGTANPAVPEPTSIVLVGTGLMGLVRVRRRKKSV